MPNRFRWLVGFVLVMSVCLLWGCEQPEDVLVPASSTELNLKAQRLPTLPEGMIYGLWVAETFDTWDVSAEPIDWFGYDFDSKVFLDASGNPRADGSKFMLDDDILNYEVVMVTVEQTSDVPAATPGPVMLWDTVTTFYENPIKMVFPLSDSLWFSTAMFNMETPSDGGREDNDGSGLWFTRYQEMEGTVRDTTALTSVSIEIDTLFEVTDTTFTTYIESIYNIRTEVVDTVFGFWDTLSRTVIRYDAEVKYDSVYPYLYNDVFTLEYEEGDDSTIIYGDYLLLDTLFIDYSPWGWRYRGWVVSEAVPGDCGAEMNMPGWPVEVGSNSWIPGAKTGYLISTGYFTDINGPDNANPYSMSDRTPPYPGEDFFETDCTPEQLVLVDGVSRGSCMITLEPVNYTSDANFPLILLSKGLPQFQSDLKNPDGLVVQEYYMDSWVRTNDNLYGFPAIVVEINRLSR